MKKVLQDLSLDQLMDLKIDYAFKQLFGNEKNKDITKGFLNAILKRRGHERIRDIIFDNTEFPGEYDGDKDSRLDILAVTDANERINIEIQFTNRFNMVKRSIYYWANVYRNTMEQGMGYSEISPVIAINILNFNLFEKETNHFHTSFHLSRCKSP